MVHSIVILGGSYGGISTAHQILKHTFPKLPSKGEYEVILVSASDHAMCRPACPRALISDNMFPQEKLFVKIESLFEQYPRGSFRFINGTATKLDHSNRTVSVKISGTETVQTLNYYALVIATGASTPSPLFGLNGSTAYLRDSWKSFREALPAAKSIVIVGGGPTGIETAGELGEYLNSNSPSNKPQVAITVITSSSQILPLLRSSLSEKAASQLAKLGVTILTNTRVLTTTPEDAGTSSNLTAKTTLALDNGQTIQADLYIPAIGTTPNTSFVPSDLLAPDKRINTNQSTLRIDAAGPLVYAIGDVSTYARPAVHNLLSAVPVLGANIKKDILAAADSSGEYSAEEKKDRVYNEDKREAQLVPIGRKNGVGAVMGYRLPGFLVRWIKGRDYWLWTTEKLWNGAQWAKEG
jgi:apoptosis-inducing factor 2